MLTSHSDAPPRFILFDLLLMVLLPCACVQAVRAGHTWVLFALVLLGLNAACAYFACMIADDRDQRLIEWVHRAPSVWLLLVVLQLWPVLLWRWWRAK